MLRPIEFDADPRGRVGLPFPGYPRLPMVAIAGDPEALAMIVLGDSMAPLYLDGDIVVCSPAVAPVSGAACLVRTADGDTIRRAQFDRDDEGRELVRLEALAPGIEPVTLPRADLAGIAPVIALIRRVVRFIP